MFPFQRLHSLLKHIHACSLPLRWIFEAMTRFKKPASLPDLISQGAVWTNHRESREQCLFSRHVILVPPALNTKSTYLTHVCSTQHKAQVVNIKLTISVNHMCYFEETPASGDDPLVRSQHPRARNTDNTLQCVDFRPESAQCSLRMSLVQRVDKG